MLLLRLGLGTLQNDICIFLQGSLIIMEAYQARLDSFNKSSKRTKQSKASSSSSHKWPHPSSFRATPKTLAEAGFYHDPSSEYKDNVTCFVCEKQLADWDKDDDPFTIHWEKCGDSCPWAIVRCGLMDDADDHGKCVLMHSLILLSR